LAGWIFVEKIRDPFWPIGKKSGIFFLVNGNPGGGGSIKKEALPRGENVWLAFCAEAEAGAEADEELVRRAVAVRWRPFIKLSVHKTACINIADC
jgi:hypothetical protein